MAAQTNQELDKYRILKSEILKLQLEEISAQFCEVEKEEDVSIVTEALGKMSATNNRLQTYLCQLERQKEQIFEDFMYFQDSDSRGVTPLIIQQSELIEIRSYTATELFKVRSKTNRLYDEFAKVKEMRNAVKEMERNATLLDDNVFNSKGMSEKLEH